MQHQLTGFWYGHKVADNALIRQRYGPAALNLPLEQRYDAACAAQHVAEARVAEHGLTVGVRAVRSCDNFAHTLGGTHDIGRVHCFIRGYHHEALYAVFLAQLDNSQRAEHVVFHGLDAVLFHQGHMLMCRRMNHNVRVILLHYVGHGLLIADGRYLYAEIQRAAVQQAQLLLQVVNAVFVNIQSDNLRRLHLRQLTAQLAADAASAAGNENDFIFIIAMHQLVINYYGHAEQQLLDVKFPQHTLAMLGHVGHGKIVDLYSVACGFI